MKKGWILSGFLVLLLALVAVALTACGGTSPLIGKWQHVEEEELKIEFFSDGRFEIGNEPFLFSGTYEETGDKEVTLTLTGVNGEEADEEDLAVFEYSFSDDELTLDDGDDPVTFTRVK